MKIYCITSTFDKVSNESIFLNRVERSLRDASWIPESRDVAKELKKNYLQFIIKGSYK